MATSSVVEILVPRKMSPKEPLPIFRPNLYLFPTRNSIFQKDAEPSKTRQKKSTLLPVGHSVAVPGAAPSPGPLATCEQAGLAQPRLNSKPPRTTCPGTCSTPARKK
mmetsp:Transcript_16937/g.33943  ORF Transcript_16937/g.33943 Transcript_16937/m.33943 type:complete len:107 (+) Transcript_16937:1437-1757(+)